ncbi:MAG: pilus assembly protein [Chloroflexi bacterium]|nr:pilus assembly protein [Chloroflexota bacterium]
MHKTSSNRQPSRSQSGQSLVELAISFPIMLLLLLGTIDFGMALYSFLILRDAAQEGALYGSFNPANKVEIESRARNIAPNDTEALFFFPVKLNNEEVVQIDILTPGEECQGSTDGFIHTITVNASFNYPMLMPFAEQVIGSRFIPLTAEATNVILQPACQ